MLNKSAIKKPEVFIDFEFNQITEKHVNLVCAAIMVDGHKHKFWLHKNPQAIKELNLLLSKYETFISYAAVAEGRSFFSLGLDPRDFKWIDLFFEYRCISNHNDRINWGKQLVDGKVKFTKKPPPKWERTEDDKGKGFKPTHSLAEATYKLTGEIRDTQHKDKMRDLIISAPEDFTMEEREAIMDYCLEDVVFLPTIFKAINDEFKFLDPHLDPKVLRDEQLIRGRYAAHTAAMEMTGYPINVENTKNFSKQVGNILFDVQREINSLFPEVKPFRWSKKDGRYSWDQIKTREWIKENNDVKRWQKTDTNAISLALDAFTQHYDFKHDYPLDNFGAQMVRYLKMKQSLYGFVPTINKNKKTFWDSVGSDGRARPYMNPYGAQSSRSQPGATGFLFLKPAWMRALCEPSPGKYLAGIDYASQEILIQAIDAEDYNLIEAYMSGDPYLYFGKDNGSIPAEGTKETHKFLRDCSKSTMLGISFLMTKYGLAIKLTTDTGRVWDEDEAQEQIDKFYNSFEELGIYQQDIVALYREQGFLKLPDGWYIFGDNDNHRSVTNVPTQGKGAAIMRRAVDLAHSKGVTVIKTLHDAIYSEGDIGKEHEILLLGDAMKEAFVEFFPPHMKKYAEAMRLDMFAWSPSYKPDSTITVNGVEIDVSNLYIDSRSRADYQKFSKYFLSSDSDLL